MNDTEKLCGQIEKLCEYLAAVSEAEGAGMWGKIDSAKRVAEMSAVLQDDKELLERVKNNPLEAEKALKWLDTSDDESVVDLIVKFFRAMYFAYLDGEKYRFLYNIVGNWHYHTSCCEPMRSEICGRLKEVAFMLPDTTPLSPEKAAEKVDSSFKEHRALFVKHLQTIAFAERELRRNAAVQRVS